MPTLTYPIVVIRYFGLVRKLLLPMAPDPKVSCLLKAVRLEKKVTAKFRIYGSRTHRHSKILYRRNKMT